MTSLKHVSGRLTFLSLASCYLCGMALRACTNQHRSFAFKTHLKFMSEFPTYFNSAVWTTVLSLYMPALCCFSLGVAGSIEVHLHCRWRRSNTAFCCILHARVWAVVCLNAWDSIGQQCTLYKSLSAKITLSAFQKCANLDVLWTSPPYAKPHFFYWAVAADAVA